MSILDIFTEKELATETVGSKTFWLYPYDYGNCKFVVAVTDSKGNKKGEFSAWKSLEKAQARYNELVSNLKEMKRREIEIMQSRFDKVEVGKIYYTQWGYEADFYEFYKVLDKKNGSVTLQKLEKGYRHDLNATSYDSRGWCYPLDKEDGKPFRKKVKSYGFGGKEKYESCCILWDKETIEEFCWH